MKRWSLGVWACVAVLVFTFQTADAGLVFQASGISTAGVDVSFKAELTISGDILTIVLTNTSPVDSANPNDTLGSFYFDIVKGVTRPTLTYASAVGDVYKGIQNGPDTLVLANADLMNRPQPKNSWIFKTMTPASSPFLGFGIGTVGNNNLGVNNFPGMNGVETSIYKGDITTSNLKNDELVKETATFTFSGLTGFTEADILHNVAFGLGTAPDSFLTSTPEPATLALLGIGGLLLRKRK